MRVEAIASKLEAVASRASCIEELSEIGLTLCSHVCLISLHFFISTALTRAPKVNEHIDSSWGKRPSSTHVASTSRPVACCDWDHVFYEFNSRPPRDLHKD